MSKTKDTLDQLAKELKELQSKISLAKTELQDINSSTESAKLKSIQAENNLNEAEEKLKGVDSSYKSKLNILEKLKKSIQNEAQDHHDQIKKLDDNIAALAAQRKTLESDIQKRKAYQKQQEVQINDVAESGNSHILDLNHEATELEKIKHQLELAVEDGKNNLNVLNNAINETENRLQTLNNQYEETNSLYQKTLDGLKARIETADSEYKLRVEKGRQIVERLEAKEKELNIKEAMLDKKGKELLDEARRLEMRRNIYKVPA